MPMSTAELDKYALLSYSPGPFNLKTAYVIVKKEQPIGYHLQKTYHSISSAVNECGGNSTTKPFSTLP